MPSDDALIAARLGMKVAAFKKAKDVLLRGWKPANDGRLYHETITERVLDMLGRKEGERKRKAEYRTRMEAERKAAESLGVPQMSHGTDEGQTWDSGGRDDTGTGTGTGTGLKPKSLSVPNGTGAEPPDGLSAKEAIFSIAVPWMVEKGMADKAARSLLGGAAKSLGDDKAWELVQAMILENPLEPAAWFSKSLNVRIKKRGGGIPEARFEN